MALGNQEAGKKYGEYLQVLPEMIGDFMQTYEPLAKANVTKMEDVTSFFCIGSGPNISTADEGALALSQGAAVPSQSFEVDNFIHGPMQTLTPGMGVLAIAAPGPFQDKIIRVTNASKIIGTKVLLLIPKNVQIDFNADVRIDMPEGIPEFLTPLVYMVPLWQTGYYFALLGRGGHPDRLSMDKPEFIEAFSYLMKKDKWVTQE
jgi:glucosamine 6-phosphate synthetase-like amidotransferase/phosphosugar isomerase protein